MTIAIQQPTPTFAQRLREWASNLNPRRSSNVQPQTIGAEAPARLRVVAYVADVGTEITPEMHQHLAAIKDYCQEAGHEVVGEVYQCNRSANYESNAKLHEALKMLETGAADILAVAELQQLAANARDVISLCETHFDQFALVSVAERIQYPERPGSLMRSLLLAIMDTAERANSVAGVAHPAIRRQRPKPKAPSPPQKTALQIHLEKQQEAREAPERARRAEQEREANLERGRLQTLAAAQRADEARKAAPTFDQQTEASRQAKAIQEAEYQRQAQEKARKEKEQREKRDG